MEGAPEIKPVVLDDGSFVTRSKGVGDAELDFVSMLVDPADGWLERGAETGGSVVGAGALVELTKGGTVSPGQNIVSGGIACRGD